MKTKSLTMLLVCAFVLAFSTCKKEPDPNIQSFELTKEDLTVGTTSATIEGTYSYAGVIDGIKVCLKENGVDKGEFEVELDGNDFSVTMTGLKPATEYQYHYAVDYGFSKPFNTEAKTFTTLSSEKPTVKALEVQRIDSTTYRIKCQVVADGGTEVTERGICWNTFGDPVPTDDSIRRYEGAAGLLEEYLVRMEHLASGKKYYVRAYAKNAAGKTGLSEEVLDFETEAPTGTSVEIELSCDPEDGGRVRGDGSYDIGTQCTAIAEANAGYTFVNWTENGNQVSSETTYTFPVTVSRRLVANFTKQAYVIYAEVEPENSGTVTGATGYDYGQECTLTATPNTGYDFQKWTKGGTTVSTNASFTFPVTETATYKAHFKIKSYTIGVSANPANGGTVEGDGTYNYGESCTVRATPAEGYAFTNWTDDDEVASEEADYTFTVTSNRTLVANFKELQPDEYSIQVSANPTEGGTVTGGGTYHEGDQCTVNANSNAGFTFINWTENGTQVSVLAEYEFTVEGNRILVANFEAQAPMEYTINVSANPSNGGTVTGGGTYQQGDQCTVEATANAGYTFINWTEDGEVASTNARYTFIVNSDRNLVANFQVQSHTISVSADPTNGGTVSGGGTYNHGENCTVSATTNDGYTFTNWTEGGNVVSTNANYTFTVTDDRTLVANFNYNGGGNVPTGAINGQFTINGNGGKVYFSKGNLQYIGSSQTWKFADHQWDVLGTTTGQNSTSQTVDRDLFGWGTSGWDSGNTYYHPWDTDNSDGSLYGPPGQYNLTGSYAQADWGEYNSIYSGSTATNGWRTLTREEWVYVFQGRSGASSKYGHGKVNGQRGMILLPDEWTLPSGMSFTPGNSSWVNEYTTGQWEQMEQNGAVFLPAAGYRLGASVYDVGSYGNYWSASCGSSDGAYVVSFVDSGLYPPGSNYRYFGFSVRLVRVAQ